MLIFRIQKPKFLEIPKLDLTKLAKLVVHPSIFYVKYVDIYFTNKTPDWSFAMKCVPMYPVQVLLNVFYFMRSILVYFLQSAPKYTLRKDVLE